MRPAEPPVDDVHRPPVPGVKHASTGRTGKQGRKAERPRDGGQPGGPSGQHDRIKNPKHTNS